MKYVALLNTDNIMTWAQCTIQGGHLYWDGMKKIVGSNFNEVRCINNVILVPNSMNSCSYICENKIYNKFWVPNYQKTLKTYSTQFWANSISGSESIGIF